MSKPLFETHRFGDRRTIVRKFKAGEQVHYELKHWCLSYGFWAQTREPRFVQKRIENMTDEEFRSWCVASRAAKRAWYRWVVTT